MNGLVSVIVPIYNVEPYLDECLHSIEAQTYKKLQVILINDGSTDGSPNIAERYAARNKGWELYHRINGGLSAALNTGLNTAKGEYIAFVDSDDSVDPSFIEVLLQNLLAHNVDISCCNLGKNEAQLDACGFWALFPGNNLFCVARWNKLYRRSLFTKPDYHFPEGKVGEDLFHAISLFRGDVSFFVTPWAGYHYRFNPLSISHNHKVSDWLNILEGWTSASVFFRSLYSDNTMVVYALGNSFEYYRKMKSSYPKAKKELRKGKSIIMKSMIWRGVGVKDILRYLRLIVLNR